MTDRAIDRQEGGSHYKDMAIQPVTYILANGLGFCEGNVVKYVTRYTAKGGIEDLRKARHYLDLLIESLDGATDQQTHRRDMVMDAINAALTAPSPLPEGWPGHPPIDDLKPAGEVRHVMINPEEFENDKGQHVFRATSVPVPPEIAADEKAVQEFAKRIAAERSTPPLYVKGKLHDQNGTLRRLCLAWEGAEQSPETIVLYGAGWSRTYREA